jgi:hypothetical protein
MRRIASMMVATSILLGGASIAIAQESTRAIPPTYYNPTYYQVPYYRPPPTMAEVKQILEAAGYKNPTDLSLDERGRWHGKAIMENHPVVVEYDRQGIWQLTP